jgi:polyhydroxyalkanoate synthesis regulator phasin
MLMGDMTSGTTEVSGTLDASAPNGGDGGFIETSAGRVKIADEVRITTLADKGKTGQWLVDPGSFNVATSGGDITGATLSTQLISNNVELQSAAGTSTSSETGNVTINLIQKLVKRGILTQEEANEMIRQAEAEAEAVRAQSQTDMVAIAQAAAVQVVATSAPAGSDLPPSSPDDIRVTHLPQPVKDQIKEEIKLELATNRTPREINAALRLPSSSSSRSSSSSARASLSSRQWLAATSATNSSPPGPEHGGT